MSEITENEDIINSLPKTSQYFDKLETIEAQLPPILTDVYLSLVDGSNCQTAFLLVTFLLKIVKSIIKRQVLQLNKLKDD